MNVELFFKTLMEIIEEQENIKIEYTLERRPKSEKNP